MGGSARLSLWMAFLGAIGQATFEAFEAAEGKSFSSPAERNFRRGVFETNLRLIEELNAGGSAYSAAPGGPIPAGMLGFRGARSFRAGVNKFADLTDEEFRKYYTLPASELYSGKGGRFRVQGRLLGKGKGRGRALQALPDRADWTQFATPVKNQKKCNSCYALGAIGRAEAKFRQNTGKSIDLSEQEIVDCSKVNKDCSGGTPSAVMDYIIQNQISFTSSYPYVGEKNSCRVQTNGRRLQFTVNPIFPYRTPIVPIRTPVTPMITPMFPNRTPVTPMITPMFPNRTPMTPMITPMFPNRTPAFPTQPMIFPTRNPTIPFPNGSLPWNPSIPSPPWNPSPPSPPPPPPPPPAPPTHSDPWNQLRRYTQIPANIQAVLAELSKGPVLLAMYVSREFSFYSSGVFDGQGCDGKTQANHSVVAFGYDLKAEVPFIKFKNSWGPDWGEAGYFKIAIGEVSTRKKGVCLTAATPFQHVPSF